MTLLECFSNKNNSVETTHVALSNSFSKGREIRETMHYLLFPTLLLNCLFITTATTGTTSAPKNSILDMGGRKKVL